jgi:hypothetical protein
VKNPCASVRSAPRVPDRSWARDVSWGRRVGRGRAQLERSHAEHLRVPDLVVGVQEQRFGELRVGDAPGGDAQVEPAVLFGSRETLQRADLATPIRPQFTCCAS